MAGPQAWTKKRFFEKMRPVLSWRTPLPDQERQPAGTLGNEDPASLRPIPRHPWSRHSELQRQDKILTGIQAQKKGCQISVLLEVEGVGLWLLFGQAVGAQSRWSSSGCPHRACFWGEGAVGH